MSNYINIPDVERAGYRLTEQIGAGGMGHVYKAWHAGLRRMAAVKVLHQPEMGERFRNEAYIHASVQHPHIAQLYECFLNGPFPCIVMEYVPGETLDVYLQKRGRLDTGEAIRILRSIISALAYLHQKDIIHRDIKPQNFKVQPDGVVKMLDFGIAKDRYTPRLTQLGFAVGTTAYMAPEQFEYRVDKRSDCWSIGVLAYELLTGYLPFEAPNPVALRHKIGKGGYTSVRLLVPGIPANLERIITLCLRTSPAQRPSAARMERWLQNGRVTRRSLRLPAVQKNSIPYKSIITGCVGLLLLFMLLRAVNDRSPNHKPPATDSLPASIGKSVRIDVPGVQHATILLPDGSRQPVPYEVWGAEGKTVQFTIQAAGYIDKPVKIAITPRRDAYEYNLEKINP